MRAKRDLQCLWTIPHSDHPEASHEPLSQTLWMAGIGRSRAGPVPSQKNFDPLKFLWHPRVWISHCRYKVASDRDRPWALRTP
jgi:hypothetical protein